MRHELGAEPRRYPALMSTALLLKTDYYRSFPDQATFATSARPEAHAELRSLVSDGSLGAHLERPVAQLRPALCYHVYDELGGSVLESDLRTFTIFGSCYRHEHTPSKRERQLKWELRQKLSSGVDLAHAD